MKTDQQYYVGWLEVGRVGWGGSVHYLQRVVCAKSIRINPQKVFIGRHPNWVRDPHTARPGHPSRLKLGTLARPLLAVDSSEYVLACSDNAAANRRRGAFISFLSLVLSWVLSNV